MKRTTNVLALLAAAAVTVLVVAGLSQGATPQAPPSNSTPPSISGTPTEGNTLTAQTGTWNGTGPVTYSYRWRRCDKNGASCADIGGATKQTYLLKAVDVGNTIRVRQSAKNSDGTTSATSSPTAVIKAATTPPPPAATGCPSGSGPVNVSQLSLPARLLIDGQSASPSTLTRSTGDLTMRFHVSACNGRSVEGALVYAAAVPFNQFSISEVPTGADGWATMTEHRLGGYPVSSKQQLLAVFVRARKSGENILSGISTRILVSFPVR
jgi:hypothetical protein